jgi:hypothetical protein
MIPPPTRPSRGPTGRAPGSAQAGIGRPGGLLVAGITAALVFGLGHRLWPQHQPEAPIAPAPPPTPATPPPPAPTLSDAAPSPRADGALSTGAADAAAPDARPNVDAGVSEAQRIRPDASGAVPRSAAEVAKPAKVAPAPTPAPAPDAPAPPRKAPEGDKEERPADKDLARQAWRSNRPDISTDGSKSSILIPLKGSIAGAGFHVTNKPHAVIVTLPQAASLITMRVYRVNRDGFRLLWINQAEKDADPKDGSSLKLGLSDWGDPLVEIKDDFVRVTIHRQDPSAPAAADHATKAPTRDDTPAVKAAAPARDDAPAPADNHAAD